MQAKLIITDLDGTALDAPHVALPTAALAEAVKHARDIGIKISGATGRAAKGALPVLRAMGVKGPAIISGGARIIDVETEKVLWGLGIPAEAVKQIIEIAKEHKIKVLWNDFLVEDYLDGAWDVSRATQTEGVYFFEYCYMSEALTKKVQKQLQEIESITAVLSSAWAPGMKDLHILNKAATKEHAIYELQEMLGIPLENTVGVGDGYNDIHLFNAVSHKVAMGNAVQELKDAADQIIGDVKEDGLAKFIEELVSKKGQL